MLKIDMKNTENSPRITKMSIDTEQPVLYNNKQKGGI